MTLSQAAAACGLPKGTFYGKARRREKEWSNLRNL